MNYSSKCWYWELSDSPVIRTPYFHCRGHRFDPWSGNQEPMNCVAWPKKEKKRRGGSSVIFSFHGVFQLIHFLINTWHVVIIWFSAFWYMCRVISLWLNWGFLSEKCCWVSCVYFSAEHFFDTAFEFFKLSSLISFHWVLWILFIFWVQAIYQICSVQFNHSVMSDSLWLHGLQPTRLPCPSPTPGACSNPCPLSRWCHPAISSSVIPFSFCPQSFRASESFPVSQLFAWGGQSIGVSASASIFPMHSQDWLPLRWTGWISLLSWGLSRVFSDSTVQKHQIFIRYWFVNIFQLCGLFFHSLNSEL